MLSNPWLRSLSCLICLLLLLRFGGAAIQYCQTIAQTTFEPTTFYWVQGLVFVLVGIAFGFFDMFLPETQKPGPWKINVARLVVLGIPTAFIGSRAYLWFPLQPINLVLGSFVLRSVGIYLTAQVLFGFVMISSLYKQL